MPTITIIGSDTCSHCRDAKDYMSRKGIPYRFVDIDNPMNNHYKSGLSAIPKICNDRNKCIVGFTEEAVDQLLK